MNNCILLRLFLLSFLFLSGSLCASASTGGSSKQALAKEILANRDLAVIDSMAHAVVKTGLNAGDGYGETWIRDYNTFIKLAMDVVPDSRIQDALLTFFRFQGPHGDIVDGFIDKSKAVDTPDGYKYRYSDTEPRYAAHKNTVETDQESSLVEAVYKYVTKSGNRAFLQQVVDGKTVLERLQMALGYLMSDRFDAKHGLIWGATTADWGDVQPEHAWGVALDEHTHYALDIYDNAFFVVAINDFLKLTADNKAVVKHWTAVRNDIRKNVRRYLWDKERQKFRPHVYLKDSPFPADFDEAAVYYHGGTAVAIEAELLSKKEIEESNAAMVRNVKESGAPTIGLTVYPPYPTGYFENKGMYAYGYQNGGDWTWFGGRMIMQLIRNGFVDEAYAEAQPMFERVIRNKGFYEWYARDGKPMGSGTFRGEAGVLYRVIQMFREWARNNA
jgi:hypothetical protein